MRMEDLDPPREQHGAARRILDSLRAHGLIWDGPVLWQSERHEAYAAVVDHLLEQQLAFRCNCSRAQLAAQGNVYRGRCRARNLSPTTPAAIRVRVDSADPITVEDRLQEPLRQDLAEEVGDFVIRRRDQLYAYQLAVVVDDAYQGVNQVVRGSDLYDSTPRQIHLQRLLGLETPEYAHIPVITNAAGQKLSKQTFAPPLDDRDATANLRLALAFLGQTGFEGGPDRPESLLQTAVEQWRLDRVPACMGIPEDALC